MRSTTRPFGVLLVNTGTPDEPTPQAVRRYLRRFLSDRRVIETHPALWRPLLEGVILRVRPRRSAALYRSVWGPDGSPLAIVSSRQAMGLQERLGDRTLVRTAGSYGSNPVATQLDALRRDGAERVLVVPMYPQYSATTTASVLDAVYDHQRRARDLVELRTIRSFPTDPGYLDAVAGLTRRHWDRVGWPNLAGGDRVLISFHGIPLSCVERGDPYPEECAATARGLRERLELREEDAPITFQSKFGPAPWLTPATIDTVAQLGRAGATRLDLICPGFAADCLETLEELDSLNRRAFEAVGGVQFERVECLNDDPAWLDALARLIERHTQGWD